jgi:hypothetical protein
MKMKFTSLFCVFQICLCFVHGQTLEEFSLSGGYGRIKGDAYVNSGIYTEPSLLSRYQHFAALSAELNFHTFRKVRIGIRTTDYSFYGKTDMAISDRYTRSELGLISIGPVLAVNLPFTSSGLFGLLIKTEATASFIHLKHDIPYRYPGVPYYIVNLNDNNNNRIENYEPQKDLKQIVPSLGFEIETYFFLSEKIKFSMKPGIAVTWLLPGNSYPDKVWLMPSINTSLSLDLSRNKWFFL